MLRRFALASASLVIVCLPPLSTGCSSPAGSVSPSSPGADGGTGDLPSMLDGLYVNTTPAAGPYSQITLIGYTGRFIAELSPCPTDGSSCEELGSFSTDVAGELEVTADGTGVMTSLPFAAVSSLETASRTLYAPGDAGVGGQVMLVIELSLGGADFQLMNAGNGAPMSTSNPPATPPVSTGTGTDAGTSAGSTADSGAPPARDPSCPVSDASATARVNPDHLMDDCELVGGSTISASDVQSFLASHGSYLARYTEGGKTAAEIIVANATASGISPLYIVSRIETESSLIESGTSNNILSAAGCACPDWAPCNSADSGFGNQITCAAKFMAGYLAELKGGGETVSGWKVGKAHATSDPCTVTPDDESTAATYSYDPWVGAYSTGCGTKKWGGATLIAQIIQRYHQELN